MQLVFDTARARFEAAYAIADYPAKIEAAYAVALA